MTDHNARQAGLTLLPCPCCGYTAMFDRDDEGWNWVVCGDCGLSTNRMASCMDDCKPIIAERWNKRAAHSADARNGEGVALTDDVRKALIAAIVEHTDSSERWAEGIIAQALLAAPAAPAQPVPDGFALVPLRMNAEMEALANQGEWEWADMLAAAEAITPKQYDEIYGNDAPAAPVQAITVWKDGSWKQWRSADAAYAQNDPDWLVTIPLPDAPPAAQADYEAVLADHRRLVRELDVLLNGDAAARQASLCDIVAQVRKEGIRSRQQSATPADGPTIDLMHESYHQIIDAYVAAFAPPPEVMGNDIIGHVCKMITDAATPADAASEAIAGATPMLLANAAFCIENWHEVSAEKRQSIIDKLLKASHAAPPASDASEADAKDAARYRFIKRSGLILSGGHHKFGWPISPFGDQCDGYIDAAMSNQAQKGGGHAA